MKEHTGPANPSGVKTVRNQHEPKVKAKWDFWILEY